MVFKMAKKKKRNNKKMKLSTRIILLMIAIFLIVISYFYLNEKVDFMITNTNINNIMDKVNSNNEAKVKKYEEYNNCLNEKYNESDNTENFVKKIQETDEFLSKYRVSIGYENPDTGFVYKYNEGKKYYAASTIKMLDALYIYENASNGNLELTDTVTYQRKHLLGASVKMGKKKFGDKVKLKDLVNYAVIYSDNIAHLMLLDYIGISNLREYGHSLGAKYTLNSDYFGEITVDDSLAYLNALNAYLNTNSEEANELKSYFVNSEQNYLNFPDDNVEAVQKYGEYDGYYHENGIVYVEHPYLVSILTTHTNNEKLIRSINSKILELHNTFYEERTNRCNLILKQ